MKGKLITVFMSLSLFCGMLALQLLPGSLFSTAKESSKNKKFDAYARHFQNLDFNLINGDKVKLSSFKEPLVLVNFWATWCTPCVKEFKSLKKLEKKLGKNKLHIVGVNVDSDKSLKQIKKFKKKHDLKFQSVLDPKTKLLDKYYLSHVPASILYHKGKVIYFKNKFTDFLNPELNDIIQKALKN